MTYVAGRRPRPERRSARAADSEALAAAARYKPVLDFLAASAVLAIPYVALRVLIVAHFNLDVAEALAVSTDPIRLVLSALLLAMPILLAAGGVACLFHGARKASRLSKGRFKAQLPWIAAGVALSIPAYLANYFGDWTIGLLQVGLLLTASQSGRYIDARNPKPPVGANAQAHTNWQAIAIEQGTARGIYKISPVFLGIFLILVAIYGPMWLPAERVDVDSRPTLAYFLNVGNGEAVLFIPDQHAVQRFPTSGLSKRQFCRIDQFETIAEKLFGGPKGLPICPK